MYEKWSAGRALEKFKNMNLNFLLKTKNCPEFFATLDPVCSLQIKVLIRKTVLSQPTKICMFSVRN